MHIKWLKIIPDMWNMQAHNKHTYLITIPFTRHVQYASSPDKKHTNTYHMD